MTVGRHVTIAGQAGVVGHITIGDNATIGAKAGVSNSIEAGLTVLGQPAVPINDYKRQIAVIQQPPKLKQEIKRLRRDLDRLLELAGEKPAAEARIKDDGEG